MSESMPTPKEIPSATLTEEKELPPIKISISDFEALEEALVQHFRKEIYAPIVRELGEPANRVLNAQVGPVAAALNSGRITFNRGVFSGRFSSAISKELRDLGARWDAKQGTWNILQSSLPIEIRNAVSLSSARFQEKLSRIDERLAKILPAEFAGSFKSAKYFDAALFKTDKEFQSTLANLTIAPLGSPEARKKIADEWQTNMDLWIKDFTQGEIEKLRKNMQASIFAGNRYESAIKTIQRSYGVSQNKAKFLARQETALLMAKYTETRYQDAGIRKYKWGCVAGSKNHPVRPRHKELAEESIRGKVFTWDKPPVTSEPGEPVRRNNPKQDYNCRCFAIPVIDVKKK